MVNASLGRVVLVYEGGFQSIGRIGVAGVRYLLPDPDYPDGLRRRGLSWLRLPLRH